MDILKTLAVYMKPPGVSSFGTSVVKAARALERICVQLSRGTLETVIRRAGIAAPGPLNGWTVPDALWLAACKREPSLSLYPLGEIAERAFKRTVLRLLLPEKGDASAALDADPKTLQVALRASISRDGTERVLLLFLTDFLYEVCRDFERRQKTGTEQDPSYLYHFPKGPRARSVADERGYKRRLLKQCGSLAAELLPDLCESVHNDDPSPLTNRLIAVYRATFGRSPAKSSDRTSRKPPLNVIVGTASDSRLKKRFALSPQAQHLLLHAEGENVAFEYASLERTLGLINGTRTHALHSLCKDLLDVGAVVYLADQMVRRDSSLQRRLDILMPVRHLALWEQTRELLAETISFLGRDEVHFHFTKKKEQAKPLKFRAASEKHCTALFSGGLDSAAGAVWALAHELHPVLVSHSSNPQASHLQSELAAELELRQDEPIPWVGVHVGRSKKKRVSHRLGKAPKSPMTQFLRSFLFLSIASVLAVESGAHQIYVFENGPIALNPMFSEGRVNTRTAHPRFLCLFAKLVEALFQITLTTRNPFLYQTKGEAIAPLAQPEYRGLVKKTNSCWNWFSVPVRAERMGRKGFKDHHDGDCLPCVVRRAAVEGAGLRQSDVPYLVDVFREFPQLPVPEQVLLADYLRFCKNIEVQGEADLLIEHPDFSVFAQDVEPRELVSMYKRHAREMIASFCARASQETIERLIPA